MAPKTKVRQITLVNEKGTFKTLFKKFSGEKKDYDFEGLSALRNLLSNEKARILHTIKIKNPISIYNLAKILERDFKSVNDDVKFPLELTIEEVIELADTAEAVNELAVI